MEYTFLLWWLEKECLEQMLYIVHVGIHSVMHGMHTKVRRLLHKQMEPGRYELY